MSKSVSLFCICFIAFSASHADIFKWTDSQGNVHFSDTPRQGAVRVDLPENQSFSAPKTQPPSEEVSQPEKAGKQTGQVYTMVSIEQPQNEETIRNNQGSLAVSVKVTPNLMKGDKVQLILDGTPIGEPQPALQFGLNGINRGSHTIAVQIVDKKGNVIITSDSITVFMFRPTVGRVHN
jgi:hypothetical protein